MNGEKRHSGAVKYVVTALVGAVMALLVLSANDFTVGAGARERCRVLCDAFTIPGVILSMCSLLGFVAKQGIFDGLSYSLKYAVSFLIPGKALDRRSEHYADYVERKQKKRSGRSSWFMLWVGLAYLALSLVFLSLFYLL